MTVIDWTTIWLSSYGIEMIAPHRGERRTPTQNGRLLRRYRRDAITPKIPTPESSNAMAAKLPRRKAPNRCWVVDASNN
jgi:hypothetical protein